MRLLFDTHVVRWWLGDEDRAGDAKTALGDARNHVFVSAAVEGLVLVTRDERLVTDGVDVLAAWKAGQTSRRGPYDLVCPVLACRPARACSLLATERHNDDLQLLARWASDAVLGGEHELVVTGARHPRTTDHVDDPVLRWCDEAQALRQATRQGEPWHR